LDIVFILFKNYSIIICHQVLVYKAIFLCQEAAQDTQSRLPWNESKINEKNTE